MTFASSADKRFLGVLEQWLQSEVEILLLIRYSRAAGAKSFEFFTAYDALYRRIGELPSETSIIAFRQPQLPLRGVVEDDFIRTCVNNIKDGSEFVVVETIRRHAGSASWFNHIAGESYSELREALEDSRGRPVAVGEYPPWLEDSGDVISAVVPDEHGAVKTGCY